MRRPGAKHSNETVARYGLPCGRMHAASGEGLTKRQDDGPTLAMLANVVTATSSDDGARQVEHASRTSFFCLPGGCNRTSSSTRSAAHETRCTSASRPQRHPPLPLNGRRAPEQPGLRCQQRFIPPWREAAASGPRRGAARGCSASRPPRAKYASTARPGWPGPGATDAPAAAG